MNSLVYLHPIINSAIEIVHYAAYTTVIYIDAHNYIYYIHKMDALELRIRYNAFNSCT